MGVFRSNRVRDNSTDVTLKYFHSIRYSLASNGCRVVSFKSILAILKYLIQFEGICCNCIALTTSNLFEYCYHHPIHVMLVRISMSSPMLLEPMQSIGH